MMAIEAKRGCGYRKVGGTYMVSGEFFAACDRLPFKLDVCPCCGEGYRPSRNIRQIWPEKMLGGDHENCSCPRTCFICDPFPPLVDQDSGHYLEWVGGNFYKTPEDFSSEAAQLGISRRLKGGIPRDLVVGKSIIFLAHRKVVFNSTIKSTKGRKRGFVTQDPGIFSAFIVNRLEHICIESEKALVDRVLKDESVLDMLGDSTKRIKQLIGLQNRGVQLIAVPDNDSDHR